MIFPKLRQQCKVLSCLDADCLEFLTRMLWESRTPEFYAIPAHSLVLLPVYYPKTKL